MSKEKSTVRLRREDFVPEIIPGEEGGITNYSDRNLKNYRNLSPEEIEMFGNRQLFLTAYNTFFYLTATASLFSLGS